MEAVGSKGAKLRPEVYLVSPGIFLRDTKIFTLLLKVETPKILNVIYNNIWFLTSGELHIKIDENGPG